MEAVKNSFRRTHWFWFGVLVISFTTYDYFEHINRENSLFSNEPWAWLGFTLASQAGVFVCIYLVCQLLARLGLADLVAGTVGVSAAIFLHVVVLGPLWDRIFWKGQLSFSNPMIPVLSAAVLYLIYRALFSLLISSKRFHKK